MSEFKKLICDFVNDTISEKETDTLFNLIVSGEYDHEIVECFMAELNRQSELVEDPDDRCTWISIPNLTRDKERSPRKRRLRSGHNKKEADRILGRSSRDHDHYPFQYEEWPQDLIDGKKNDHPLFTHT